MPWISSGMPYETPDDEWSAHIGNINDTLGERVSGLFQDSISPILGRAIQRGGQEGSSPFDQGLRFEQQLWTGDRFTPTGPGPGYDHPTAPQHTPTLPADEINAKYAPAGTKIADQPMEIGLAEVLGQQKQDEMDREASLSRWREHSGFLEQFATGAAVSMLDPLNLATAFVPGVGEEAILGRFGFEALEAAPWAARLAARGISGFTAGAAAQAPLTALKLGLSPEEGGDYSLRQAFLDMAMSGGLNAAFHAGFGALGDAYKARGDRASNPVVDAIPRARHDATNAGVSQMVEGRPVDVTPVFGEAAASADQASTVEHMARSANSDLFERADALEKERAELQTQLRSSLDARQQTPLAIAAQEQIDTILGKVNGIRSRLTQAASERLADAEAALQHALTIDTPELVPMRERLAEVDAGRRDLGPQIYDAYRTARENLPTPVVDLFNLAAEQQALYRSGYAQGVPQADFDRTNDEIFGQAGEEAQAKPTQPTQPANTPPGAKAPTPEEQRVAQLEATYAQATAGRKILPEERAVLNTTQRATETANKEADGLDQAASCLREAGI